MRIMEGKEENPNRLCSNFRTSAVGFPASGSQFIIVPPCLNDRLLRFYV